MMKRFKLIGAIATLALLAAGAWGQVQPYEGDFGPWLLYKLIQSAQHIDDGNAFGNAVTLSPNATQSGSLNAADDVDYFRINITESGTLTVYAGGEADTYVQLYDEAGNLIQDGSEQISFYYDNPFQGIKVAIDAGTYYVSVQAPEESKGGYAVQSKFTIADDHGDTFADATDLALGGDSLSGSIDHPGDVDYFRFHVSQPSYVSFLLENKREFDFHRLYNEAGERVQDRSPLDIGTYYLAAYGFKEDNSPPLTYTLHSAARWRYATKQPIQAFRSAVDVPVNSSQPAVTSPGGQATFRISITDTGLLYAGLRDYGYPDLYDSAGELLTAC